MDKLTNKQPEADLYDTDFFKWTQAQAAVVQQGRWSDIDAKNLAEEIECVGGALKSDISNRLANLLAHLLKWEFLPQQRIYCWKARIMEERIFIDGLIEDSPSLKRGPADALARSYRLGRVRAALETDVHENMFPVKCPYSLADVRNYRFYSGAREPWID